MTMGFFGYQGKILEVDLGTGRVWASPSPADWLELYIGGMGLGSRYLYARVGPEIDPFHPQNILVVATGPAGE